MPFDALPDRGAAARLVEWLDANERPDRSKRVIMTPHKSGGAIGSVPILTRLATKSTWISANTGGGPRGGPVVAAWATEESLIKCVSRVRDSTLTVFEWGKAPAILGWATAVGAFNAQTAELTTQLDPELHDEFMHMLFRDDYLSEPPKSERGRRYVQEHMRNFRESGLDGDFVVTYLIALGCRRDPKRIREHYRAAG